MAFLKKTAGAVVFYRSSDGKIEYLLLKHNPRYWYFPKGGIEKGESEVDAAMRETREETGLRNIEIVSGFKVMEKFSFRGSKNHYEKLHRGKMIFKTVDFFLIQSKDKKVEISFEHQGFEWLDLSGAIERLGKNRAKKKSQGILENANNFILNKSFTSITPCVNKKS